MKIYCVGGAIRDALLGLPIKDRDFVVVGATPEAMMSAGFIPVGKDFPVFLHPLTKAEYALARTERKTARGYHGFVFYTSPQVTLEQDLARRDLSINALAREVDNEGHFVNDAIVDPFNGQADLAHKIFRHVSDAFAEDPVRILRLARFAARFSDFAIAPNTQTLMQNMVRDGEVDALVPERVWQEFARGLMAAQPARMLHVLQQVGALVILMPELKPLWAACFADDNLTELGHLLFTRINQSAQQNLSLSNRFAVLVSGLHCLNQSKQGDAAQTNDMQIELAEQLCARLKIPAEVRDTTLLVLREQAQIIAANTLTAAQMVSLFERCDAFRRPERFINLLPAALLATPLLPHQKPQQALLVNALQAVQNINSGDIAKATAQLFPNQPQKIAQAIFNARIDVVAALLNQ